MSEHDDPLDGRFGPIVRAELAPMTSVGVLAARVEVRSRRRRRAVVGVTASALVLLAGLAAAARTSTETGDQRVTTEPTTKPVPSTEATLPATATPESGVRLVLGPTPDGMAFSGCALLDELVTGCSYDIPTTAIPDGLNVNLTTETASEDALSAWRRGDATAFAAINRGADKGGARFTTVGGRRAVADSPEPPIDGSPFEMPDRSWQAYYLIIDDHQLQVFAEGLTTAQLDGAIAGLALEPVDTGFALPPDILPQGSRVAAQGPVTVWDGTQTGRGASTERSGRTSMTFYALPGQRTGGLHVTVTTGTDASAEVRAAERRGAAGPGGFRTQLGGRNALVPATQEPGLMMTGRRDLVVAVDETTFATVTAPPSLADLAEEVAAAITVR